MAKNKRKNRRISVLTSDFDSFSKKIEDCKNFLRDSPFYDKLRSQINHCIRITPNESVSSILCYGLGNFTSSIIARYQLALLLLLTEYLDVGAHIYDPVFSEIEISFLIRLNMIVIEENEEGARKIASGTFIFMPHCPTALVNNFLWCNWNPRDLSRCLIMTNSFKSLAESQISRCFRTKYYYVHFLLPATVEVEIENIFKYTDIFNDLGLHIFSKEALAKFEPDFWMKNNRPVYDETEIECISGKLSKNLRLH